MSRSRLNRSQGLSAAGLSTQMGVTMVEILVAIIISAIGFLGLASVQLLGAKGVSSSNYRTLATIYAYDMTERMRSNPGGVSINAYNESVNTTDATCSSNCSPSAVAHRDLVEWRNQIEAEVNQGGLPNGAGRIVYNPADQTAVISVEWSEVVIAPTTTSSGAGPIERQDLTQSFTLEVKL